MGYRIESVLVPTLDPILWFVLFTLDIDGQAITLVWSINSIPRFCTNQKWTGMPFR